MKNKVIKYTAWFVAFCLLALVPTLVGTWFMHVQWVDAQDATGHSFQAYCTQLTGHPGWQIDEIKSTTTKASGIFWCNGK